MAAETSHDQHLFVSYASADQPRVLEIAGTLESTGLGLWIDRASIPGGVSYGPEISAAIKSSSALLLMCSAAAFASRNVRQEIQLAWRYERPILPLLLEPVAVPDDLAYWLEGAQWIELHNRQSEMWLPQLLHSLARFGLEADLPEALDADPAHALRATLPPSNLPALITGFVGREQQLAELRTLLLNNRLVTLTGAGGSGKTQLAIETARRDQPRFPGGTWLVELATVTDPKRIMWTIGEALDLREESGVPLLETLAGRLNAQPLLLVLDNCEHLLVECARIVESLLARCPHLRILTTSREPLGVSGETVFRVPVLRLPEAHSTATAASVYDSEAGQLFVTRARSARPGFELTDANAPEIARICQRLDGIPLAIELAAARIKLLDPSQLAERLDQRFQLLTGGSRTSLPRHQTLRGLVDWSYALLNEAEAALFTKLAVFSGGWTLEAAEMVGSNGLVRSETILDVLEQLVDKSLIATEESHSGLRFTILETLREYALEQLQATGDESAVRDRHVDYILVISGGDSPQKRLGDELTAWLRTIDADLDNVRTALTWSLERSPETGLRLASNLSQFWYVRGFFSEGRAWFERLLAQADGVPSELLGDAHVSAAVLARAQGEQGVAKTFAEQAVAIARLSADNRRIARGLYVLGSTLQGQGDADQAIEVLEEALRIARELELHEQTGSILNVLGDAYYALGDHARAIATIEEGLALKRMASDAIGTGVCLLTIGALTLSENDPARAEACFEEALAIFRQVGDPENIAVSLLNLGEVAIARGNKQRAASLCADALGAFKTLGDRSGIAYALEGLARVAIESGGDVEGVRWLGAAESIREAINEPLPVEQRDEYQQIVAAARTRLGDDRFESAWAMGRRLPVEAATDGALAFAQVTASSGAEESPTHAVEP